MDAVLSDEDLLALYTWVDNIPLSRAKQKITRDFSDGVLMAEVAKFFYPKLVDLHNYSAAHSMQQKLYNWETLNAKVFRKIKFPLSKHDIEQVVNCVDGVIQRILWAFKAKVQSKGRDSDSSLSSPSFGSASKSGGPAAAAPSKPAPAPAAAVAAAPASVSSAVPLGAAARPRPLPSAGTGSVPPAAGPSGAGAAGASRFDARLQRDVDSELLVEKETRIQEMAETIEILEQKVARLKELVRLKDQKIQDLTNRLQAAGLV